LRRKDHGFLGPQNANADPSFKGYCTKLRGGSHLG